MFTKLIAAQMLTKLIAAYMFTKFIQEIIRIRLRNPFLVKY